MKPGAFCRYFLLCFNGSEILKVLVDQETNSFHFVMKLGEILYINVYDDLVLSLKEAFNKVIKLSLEYDGDDYSKVGEYLNRIIDRYSKDSIRYGVFKDRKIETNENL